MRALGVLRRRRQRPPTSELSWLASALRRTPLRGTYVDGEGTSHDVQLTEAKLLNWLLPNPGYEWAGPGEIAQAARAFRGGDPAPCCASPGQNDLEPGPGRLRSRVLLDRSQPGPSLRGRAVPVDQVGAVSEQRAGSTHEARARSRPSTARSRRAPGCARRPPASSQSLMQPDPCIASTWADVPAYPGRDDGAARAGAGDERRVRLGRPDIGCATRHRGAHRQHVRQIPRRSTTSGAGQGARPSWSGMFYRTLHAALIVHEGAGVPEVVPGRLRPHLRAAAGCKRGSGVATLAQRRAATSAVWAMLDSIRHSFDNPFDTQPGLRGGMESYQGFDEDAQADVFGFDAVRFTRRRLGLGHSAMGGSRQRTRRRREGDDPVWDRAGPRARDLARPRCRQAHGHWPGPRHPNRARDLAPLACVLVLGR